MTNRLWQSAIDRAGVLTAPFALDDLSDAELHQRFLANRDEAAFATLVRRHGSLVWSVCRSLLACEADAEDAFQATFLVLVRSAKKANKPRALGAWLHTVAGRVCRNSLRSLARRKKHERNAAIAEGNEPVDSATWERWHAVAHEEIDRLPESLRVPFILCVLQGVRQPEAAKQLGWKLGTVSGRICKAKQALTDALSRRGVAATVAAALGSATMPLSAALSHMGIEMIRFGTGSNSGFSSYVHELARGAMGGIMTKTKLLTTALVVGTLAVGVGTLAVGVGSQLISEAGAQPGASPPGIGVSPKPAGLGGAPPVLLEGSPGSMMPGLPGDEGTGSSFGVRAARSSPAKIEYLFVAKQVKSDDFKNTLTKKGEEGWEYAGLVPGTDELVFKRGVRLTGMSEMGGSMMRPGIGGMGSGGGIGAPPGTSGPSGGSTPGSSGAGNSEGSPPPGVGGGGGGVSPPKALAPTIDLQVGETTRYAMSSSMQIRSFVSPDSKVVEVTLDPLDHRRIVIRTLGPGVGKLILTDSLGAKETYTIRVR